MKVPPETNPNAMAVATPLIELTDGPLDVARVLGYVTDPACGAEVLFVGTTRRWTTETRTGDPDNSGKPRETSHLVYEAYREMAISQLSQLAETAIERWPVRRVAIVHRVGRVDPTEPSVAVAVSCPHRGEAFEAAQWLIDTLKHEAPIWKQEHYVQSGPEWIHPDAGSCRCGDDAQQRQHAQPRELNQTRAGDQQRNHAPLGAAVGDRGTR